MCFIIRAVRCSLAHLKMYAGDVGERREYTDVMSLDRGSTGQEREKTENEAEKGERDCWGRGQAGKGGEGEKEQQRGRLYVECNGPELDQQDGLLLEDIGFTARFSCMARR